MTLLDDVGALVGAAAVRWHPIDRGNHAEHRLQMELADGRRCFVKADVRAEPARALRAEAAVAAELAPGLGPAVVASGTGPSTGAAVVVFEWLDGVRWPPPWRPGDVDAVCRLLTAVAAAPVPAACAPLSVHRGLLLGWERIAADAEMRESVGLLDLPMARQAARRAPHLRDLAAAADLDGHHLVHFDVRSDNLYLRDRAAGLVDWAWAARGPTGFDLASWAPSLHTEGGPAPWVTAPDADGPLVALLAGYWASQAVLPEPPGSPGLRALQRRQLGSTLDWLAQLGLLEAPGG